MKASTTHRLDGLEPDNLLAFLALLGTLRAIEKAQPKLQPCISWTVDEPPLRPCLHVAQALEREALAEAVARGVGQLAEAYDFGGRTDLNFTPQECRKLLAAAAEAATPRDRTRADLLAALMHDAAVKDGKDPAIDPTPLCLLFGQGHQHFLQRLTDVPRAAAPPPRGKGRQAAPVTAAQAIGEALFEIWHRQDPTPSFRWDPAEDVRYATMGGDPTDPAFKVGTQHGANRLAAVGLPALGLAARSRGSRVRTVITAGRRDGAGTFTFAWPIWQQPMGLRGIIALLTHPQLHTRDALAHLGVVDVLVVQRISVGKFMNFTRARPV